MPKNPDIGGHNQGGDGGGPGALRENGMGAREARPVAFMFSGLGDQYVNMGRGLYDSAPAYREALDRCADILQPHLEFDFREVLYPHNEPAETFEQTDPKASPGGIDLRKMLGRESRKPTAAARRLNRTAVAHPAVFAVEYALARLWMTWGVRPRAMAGHSIGEYVAACVAGVLSLPDALALVAKRAQVIEDLPEGAMLAVPLSEEELRRLINGRVSIAAVNTPAHCVVSGPAAEIAALEGKLTERAVVSRRVEASHAFHSPMMEAAEGPLTREVRSLTLNGPKIPYVSNVTGTWITDAEATDPGYWARHAVDAVRFSEAVELLCRDPETVLLEIGPGRTLCSFALQHPAAEGVPARAALPSMPHAYERRSDVAVIIRTAGDLWLADVPIDWAAFHGSDRGIPSASARAELRTPFIPPQGPVQEKLADIWTELLGIDRVGAHDNFLELGGNSLIGARIVARTRDAFKVDLDLSVLFTDPTVAELAAVVAAAPKTRTPPIRRIAR